MQYECTLNYDCKPMKRGMFLSFVELIQLNQSNSDLLQAAWGGSQVTPATLLTDGRKRRAPTVGGQPKPKWHQMSL